MTAPRTLGLWRITPVATPDDPTWQGRPLWLEVLVRAPSAAEARVIAAGLHRDPHDLTGSLEQADLGGGFFSEKLYRVTELAGAEAQAEMAAFGEGGPGLLRAVQSVAPSG